MQITRSGKQIDKLGFTHTTPFKRMNSTYTSWFKGDSLRCWVKNSKLKKRVKIPQMQYLFSQLKMENSLNIYHWKASQMICMFHRILYSY